MSYISAIGTANPPHRIDQSVIAEFMLRAMKLRNGDARRLRSIFRASGIAYRHSVLADYGKTSDFSFYPDTDDLEPFPGTEKRLRYFRENALALSVASFRDMTLELPALDRAEITHLIVVCCTGMYAPGLDIDLVHALKLSPGVQRTAIQFMGCHAAFNALRIADAFCKSDDRAKVLIVSTELCSLHFQRQSNEDNLLANALFGDGSASVLVEAQSSGPHRLLLEAFHSELSAEGVSDMAWTIGDVGFEMKLTAYVPDLIRQGISGLANGLLRKVSSDISAIRHFAIHPGGKKILQVIEQELKIDPARNDPAYHVLRNYGNMSSPTVLFVLKEVMRRLNGSDNGERILCFAFGPGLTLESMVLKIENYHQHA